MRLFVSSCAVLTNQIYWVRCGIMWTTSLPRISHRIAVVGWNIVTRRQAKEKVSLWRQKFHFLRSTLVSLCHVLFIFIFGVTLSCPALSELCDKRWFRDKKTLRRPSSFVLWDARKVVRKFSSSSDFEKVDQHCRHMTCRGDSEAACSAVFFLVSAFTIY